MSNCFRATNNKYFSCPALMSDGRSFTDYRPSCEINNEIRNEMNIMTSSEFRNFLINNAKELVTNDRLHMAKMNGCDNCAEPYDVGTMLPEKHMVSCENGKCETKLNEPHGLGTGRMYATLESCDLSYTAGASNCANNLDKVYN